MKYTKLFVVVVCAVWFNAASALATIYYAGTGGSDANSCATAQNISTPKLTFAGGKSCLTVPGDELKLKSGTNFTDRMDVRNLIGTSVAPYKITVNSGTVTFTAPSLVSECRVVITSTTTQWLIIDGTAGNLVWDGVNCADALTGNRIDGPTNFTMRGVEIKSFKSSGFLLQNATNVLLEKLYIHDQISPTCADLRRYYGIYMHHTTNVTLRNSRIVGNPGGGMQIYPGPHNGIEIYDNDIHGNNSCSGSPIGGMVIASNNTGGNISNVSVHHNLIYNNGAAGGGGGIRLYTTANVMTGTKIYNNLIYANLAGVGDGYGIKVEAGPINTEIKNNHIVSNTSGAISDVGTGTITSNNRTTGSVTDCTPSTSDFTQKAGSSCIDAGVDVGLSFNGSAPDIGAFETFTLASCEVPFSAANTIQATFNSNANLLGSTLTTFTARKNSVSNALTGAASKVGDTIISLPLTSSYVGGDTADISWSSGGLTDNTLIGGDLNQPYRETLTNRSCTNNAAGAATYALTQARFQFRGVFGSETTTDIRGAENRSSYNVVQNGALRVRTAVTDATANAPSIGLILRYSKNGGAYTVVPSTAGADGIAMCEDAYQSLGIVNGQSTTSQLTTGGTFVPGAVILRSSAIPTIVGLNIGYKTELEHCVRWVSGASGVFTLRLYEQNGTPLNTYTATPTITVVPPQASGG